MKRFVVCGGGYGGLAIIHTLLNEGIPTDGFGMLGKHPMVGYVPRVIKSGILWMSRSHKG